LGVTGFPTIVFFPGGKKDVANFQTYNGPRELEDLVQFASTEAQKSQPAKIAQLLDQKQIDSCENSSACLIAFLPHISESSDDERAKYVAALKQVAEKNKGTNVQFFWSEATEQTNLEEALGLQDFPAFVGLSTRKKAYASLLGAFNFNNVDSFTRNLISGQEKLKILRQEIPKIKTVKEWKPQNKKNTDL